MAMPTPAMPCCVEGVDLGAGRDAAAGGRSVAAARRRHRQSPKGRLDHRDHQRAYRARVEIAAVLKQLTGTMRLIVLLLYGTGVRIKECVDLRAKELDFDRHQVIVRQGKGRQDRVTMLPSRASRSVSVRM